MSNSNEHFKVGAVSAAVLYITDRMSKQQPIEFWPALGYGLTGGISSLVPDLLEPANSPNHRNFMHSMLFAALLAEYKQQLEQNQALPEKDKMLWQALITGYWSHLSLDAKTPRGLPLI
jgi:membrane-bound metal-dependent hydrolase YbcI (DUF457 family)